MAIIGPSALRIAQGMVGMHKSDERSFAVSSFWSAIFLSNDYTLGQSATYLATSYLQI